MAESNESEKLQRGVAYDFAGDLLLRDAVELFQKYGPLDKQDLSGSDRFTAVRFWVARHIKAVATTEFRPPKKGELYFSGAIINAYRAPANLNTAYRIGRLVRVEEKVIQTIFDL